MDNIPVFNEVERLRTAYEAAKENFETAKGNYDAAKADADNTPKTITTTSTTTVYENNYFKEYERFYEATSGKKLDVQPVPKMWYGIRKPAKGASIIYFALTDFIEDITESIKWEETDILPQNIYWGEDEDSKNPNYLDILDGFTVKGITYTNVQYGCFFYRNDGGDIAMGDKVELKSDDTDAYMAFLRTWYGSKRLQPTEKTTTTTTDNTLNYNAAQSQLTLATKELYAKERARNTARANFNTKAVNIAEKENNKLKYDEEDSLIVCEKQYNNIKITADFTASSTVADEWPANYTLNGNGHIITTNGGSLFGTNNGTINTLATPDGHIANVNNSGNVYWCLTSWLTDDNKTIYCTYNGQGTKVTYNTIDEAIYSMRKYTVQFPFGYDMENKEIKPYSNEYKLYQAKYANGDNKTVYTFRLNIQKNADEELKLKYDEDAFEAKFINGYTDQNAILYIDDADAKAMVKDRKNVAVMENGAYYCYNTVLEDGATAKEFYIPFDFKSKKLNYLSRTFNKKVAAVCLPFKLSETLQKSLGIESTYQFNDVDEGTGVMWFTYLAEIEANKPCLISFPEENDVVIFKNNGVIFKDIETTLDFKAIQDGDMILTNAFGSFYGNYASKTPAQLLGGGSKDAFYAVQDGWLVKTDVNNTKSRLHQFRSYVVRPYSSNEAPSYKIGLMDEDGNEVTAIETVSGEVVTGFKAKGGDNAIEITTTEACPVKVYALNGALVKSTRVEAGTTSLPVKAGIYVVNGAKVIVK